MRLNLIRFCWLYFLNWAENYRAFQKRLKWFSSHLYYVVDRREYNFFNYGYLLVVLIAGFHHPSNRTLRKWYTYMINGLKNWLKFLFFMSSIDVCRILFLDAISFCVFECEEMKSGGIYVRSMVYNENGEKFFHISIFFYNK